ncbi:Type IV secretion-system coupling protein DNA-binding domain-containing protein [Mucilaginibacter pineti]|uniref:Type IV secretion-system coupling protein DNA-binding domain-containing protein n=1 Tax=Mucilaginibacter pineti TaxID=1391627 RepID=A0A1G7FD61_9SPHI|nr:type IV secretion system DNA-binding domain-containing protein [Mucilaginibacter pineti]SDE73756.1 Type IV secretion-system coupling protein DNA-binding domain-containing protein [Mucilaginibacter pineti]
MALSLSHRLTANFYRWERHGRGWHIADRIVELEPPFQPFRGHEIDTPYIDDGKRHTALSTVASWFKAQQAVSIPPAVKDDAAAYPDTDGEPELAVYSIALARNFAARPEPMEHCLTMLASISLPMSFELIAEPAAVTIQVTCRQAVAAFVYAQLTGYFPELSIRRADADALLECIASAEAVHTVDMGIGDEFMRPVAAFGKSGPDPYTALFGTLNQLRNGEAVVVQVLFCGAQNAWAESIMASVTDDRGGSFFTDAPEMPGLAREKVSRPLFGATIRIAAFADHADEASELLRHSALALIVASRSPSNALIGLDAPEYAIEMRLSDLVMRQTHRVGMLLNTRELATFVHFPPAQLSKKLMPNHAATKRAPAFLFSQPYVLGINEHQGQRAEVGIDTEQRLKHLHVIGGTGMGKSTLLHSLVGQDMARGIGCCVLDPHGDLIDAILRSVPQERIQDVVLIDPSDGGYPVGLNILQAHSDIERELLASDLVALFRRFSTSWGDQLHSVLANAIMAFLYNTKPGHIGDLRKFLIEPSFRAAILQGCADEELAYYWQREYPLLKTSSIGSILTRLDSFLRPKSIRAMVCQHQGLDFHGLMNGGKIVLVKLAQGLIGSENSYLLGALIVAKLQQAALARQQQQASNRTPFFCYIDEFHHFITPSLNTILSGARKYGLGLVCVHQDMQQLLRVDGDIASSLMSNAGTRICFRLGDADARRMQEGFSGFGAEDFQNLNVGAAIARVNTADADFNLFVLPREPQGEDRTTDIIAASRERYGVPVAPQGPIPPPPSAPPPQEPPVPPPAPSPTVAPRQRKAAGEQGPDTEHRYLQSLIKAMGERHGYRANIEVPTKDGKGQIDVLLSRDDERIAFEVSINTDADWEMHNIAKCLADGCTKVAVCSGNARRLSQIGKRVRQGFPPAEQSKIHLLSPDDLPRFFNAAQAAKEQAATMKGYRVKVTYDQKGSNGDAESVIKRIARGGK